MSSSQLLENFDEYSVLPDSPMSPASTLPDTDGEEDEDMDLGSELTDNTMDSSPMLGQKEKRLSSITPRKFNRFFTPRSLQNGSSRQALFDITAPALNDTIIQSSPLRPYGDMQDSESSPETFPRDLKRRKVSHLTESSTEKGSNDSTAVDDLVITGGNTEHGNGAANLRMSPFKRAARKNVDKEIIAQAVKTKPKMVLEERGLSGRLLQMSLGSSSNSRRKYTTHAVGDFQNETANFYSGPADTHLCNSHHSGVVALPFCTAACNRSSLVALGDETGRVKILESDAAGNPPFHESYLLFHPHTNAIFDMSFSEDDSLIATASADQNAKVTDMVTQQTISTLAQHTASVKQVRFQPGSSNNSVLATCSRDGSVEIWDLRCSGSGGAIKEVFRANDPILDRVGKPGYGYAINSIYEAHKPYIPPSALGSKRRASERNGIPSVTTVQFMPEGREHLLLTASEDNACVRLWDIRALYQTHKEWAIPLSSTEQPPKHNAWRNFGIISMNLSGDGSRLYTLCKDSTIYTYSTSHLILGHAPELSVPPPQFRRPADTQRYGLGALYGFRHPKLLTSSFYVKTSMRKEKDGKCEMLAVGSSKDGCAILFPTDERYHSFSTDEDSTGKSIGPILRKRSFETRNSSSGGGGEEIPISRNGTALIQGHEKEVSSLSWTSEGELVTMADDYLVRCWREGDSEARALRVGGEEGGQRWSSGWADVGEGYDDDDE